MLRDEPSKTNLEAEERRTRRARCKLEQLLPLLSVKLKDNLPKELDGGVVFIVVA